MIHICKLIATNSKTVFFIFKGLTNALITQFQSFVPLLMSICIIDYLQIIQIKQYNTSCLKLNFLFIQIFTHILIGISVHGFCQHIHISHSLQIYQFLLSDILIIKSGYLYPDQYYDKYQRPQWKKYRCLFKIPYIIHDKFHRTKYHYNIYWIFKFTSSFILKFNCFIMDYCKRINYRDHHQCMSNRQQFKDIYNPCTLEYNLHCHIHHK